MYFAYAISLLLAGASIASPVTPTLDKRTGCDVGISPADAAAVKNAFTSSGVVPTVVPSIDPKVKVEVTYGSKQVNLGNQFLTTETLQAPKLSFSAEKDYPPATTRYSYFLYDPDVPNAGAAGLTVSFLHWYVAHAAPICSTGADQTVTIYEALTPASPQQHRYAFLVYREPPGYNPDAITAQLRPGFNLQEYTKKAGLVLVGGNFLREAITNGVVPS